MTASLLSSAVAEARERVAPPRPAPKAAGLPGSLATAGAPSVTLPLRFVLFGLLSLFLGAGLLVARPDLLATYHYNQFVIAVTHLFTLGFILSVVMGALYQLVPVALETRLHSERLAKWQFVLHVIGVVGMVWMFWKWDLKQVGHFGSVLAAGFGLFAWNLARTLRRVPRWNFIAGAVTAALVWLSLALLAGLAIAAGKCTYESAATLSPSTLLGAMVHALQATARFLGRFDQLAVMHAHAHLGAVGGFLMLIVGLSCKLVPMFALSELQSARRARLSLWLLNLGLGAAFFAVVLRSPLKPLAALVLVAGLAIFGWELRAILRARQRRVLDWGLVQFLTALWLLVPVSLLGLLLSWPRLKLTALTGQLENLYGFLALVGVVTGAILGMLYKILPFLVWFARYSRELGRRKVPALADLYSPRLQAVGYWTFVAGLAATSAAIVAGSERLMPWCSGLLALSLGVFAVNAGLMLKHFFRPVLGPLPAPKGPARQSTRA